MMTHNEYWKTVWEKAHERLDSLISKCGMTLDDILEHEDGIVCIADGKAVLAYVLRHHPTCDEEACAILSVFEAVQAVHEMHEHESETDETTVATYVAPSVSRQTSATATLHSTASHSPIVVK